MKKMQIFKGMLALSLLLGCSKSPLQTPTYQHPILQQQSTQAASQTPKSMTVSITPQKIKLAPVSKETVTKQVELQKTAATKSENTPAMDPKELETIKTLLAQVEEKIAEEDQAHAKKSSKDKSFSVKSAEGGKDVSIGMLLYNAKYIRKAEFWGLKNANDFLMAGRSPLRRWTLRLKLEGLFAPNWFHQQLLFWVEQADLLRIPGVSRDDAFLLVANGVTSVPDLARRDNIVEIGALKVSMTIMALQYGMHIPSIDEMKKWVDDAKTMEPIIY